MGIWNFIQNQVLGMKWLNELVGFALSALGVDVKGRIGGSIQFFIYDVMKITVLLCVLIFVISYIQSYFPPERSRHILGRFRGIWADIIAALLGTVTPFCSCSSIPLFYGLYQCWIAHRCDVLIFNFVTYGGFRKLSIAYEHFRC